MDILPESFNKHMEVSQRTNDDGKVVIVDPKHEALCQTIVDIHKSVKEVN